MTTDNREIAWRSHPWMEEPPAKRAALIAAIVGASAIAGIGIGALWAGLVSAGFLLISVSRYLLPTTYVVNAEGVRVQFLGIDRALSWTRFRRAALRPDGVFLGTFATPRRLDVWRGCYLRCPHDRESVYAIARAHIAVEPDRNRDEPRVRDAGAP